MSAHQVVMLVFTVLGGLALFIYGMNVMTDGLRGVAGGRLRKILAGAGHHRWNGLFLGIVLGTTIQTSAATVMMVGLINAGLMTLLESIPPMLGANIGTTLAMHLISFRLGDYCFAGIALGLLMAVAGSNTRVRPAGQALLGFGLLFLGMNVMSGAVKPYREMFAPFLAGMDGATWKGLLTGVGIATAVTAVIQSSGGTIAMVFAMISAGIITRLEQAYPIIVGANIGTCMTALLGSIGTGVEARRSAISHLAFNIFSGFFGVLTASWFYRYIPLTSGDLIHQAANANTIKMVISVALIFPFISLHSRLVCRLVPAREPLPEPSHLDVDLLPRPEDALAAVLRELRRVAVLCQGSFRDVAEMIVRDDRRGLGRVARNEQAVDEIKLAVRDYLRAVTGRSLSRRQAILVQYLNRAMVHLERIHDHIELIGVLSGQRHAIREARFDRQGLDWLYEAYDTSARTLNRLVESLDASRAEFKTGGEAILAARDEHVRRSHRVLADFTARVAAHEYPPICGVYFIDYISALDRIVRHCKVIAFDEIQQDFRLKPSKFGRTASLSSGFKTPDLVDQETYLAWVRRERFGQVPPPADQVAPAPAAPRTPNPEH
ncbi:MAG: Na/Pi cotransporter family protein [Kiritimatiellae bacterium]|nr:Na/Pi cotransporter family protein [Kiritimatiellia bacterium]